MNFDFLNSERKFNELKKCCEDAELFCNTKPYLSCGCSRLANEFIINYIYKNYVDNSDVSKSTFEKLTDPGFIEVIDDEGILDKMHTIRKLGNAALHETDNIDRQDSLDALRALHYVAGEFAYNVGLINEYDRFVEPSINNDVYSFESEPAYVNEPTAVYNFSPNYFPIPKMRNAKFIPSNCEKDDKYNRNLFVRASIKEAGWKISKVEDQLMPCLACMNIKLDNGETVDIAFPGKDNRPLGIVETFEPGENFMEARNRVIHKAELLEQKYGYKPIAYYTDNYHFYCIDQLGYPPRRVFDFHSLDEMELLIQRRNSRKNILNPEINPNITDRDYQKEAINAVCKAFSSNRRRSLVVMATGTGKTRVAVSLVDILLKNNWVKNILFLADRTSLVRQAKRSFTNLLPNVTTSEYSGESFERDPNARIVFSTYQTMINLINDDTREFGIGRFDLIIVDEAHRSIFKKYGALFDYFDSLMIGLTATPRSEDNKNTYDIFGLPNGEPDYAYELKEAVDDGYLVGFYVNDRVSSLMQRKIGYRELSDEEKERLEDVFEENGISEDDDVYIDLNNSFTRQKVVSLKTIDVMLGDLLKHGLKVNGGDKIGKTIIFAENHFEATQIVERFNQVYANGDNEFCVLIDSTIENRYVLLDKFCEKDSNPQIAVSVDMLDTGVDVPEILNLVFYKPVKSRIKFLQMIGRGTRLCKDLLGPGEDKNGFCIFDYFDNFDYFDAHFNWNITDELIRGQNSSSQSQYIYRYKLGVLNRIQDEQSSNSFDKGYRNELINEYIGLINSLSTDDIRVQENMDYINKYRSSSMWENLTKDRVEVINNKIIPLFCSLKGNVREKAFDLIMYKVEYIYKNKHVDSKFINYNFTREKHVIAKMVKALEKLKTIPDVVNNMDKIESLKNLDAVLNDFSIEKCEQIRKELRHLMNYVPDETEYYTICIDDKLDYDSYEVPLVKEKSYSEKVNEYLKDDTNFILNKIRNLDDLDVNEKEIINKVFKEDLGDEAEYLSWANNMPLLAHIRLMIGFTNEAIETKFGSFYNTNVLDERQYALVSNIISYVRTNGDITFADLSRVPQFSNVDIVTLFGDKIVYIKELINGLHKPVGE